MKQKKEFSKVLLIQESALIWIVTLICLAIAFYCIVQGFSGSLPWISSIVVAAWGAYGVSQAMYYRKAMKENTTGGIKFESVMEEARKINSQYKDASGFMAEENIEEEIYISKDVDNYQI